MLPLPPLPQGLDVQDLMTTLISPVDDPLQLVLAAIASAETSIYVGDYGFNEPRIADALIARAQAGVRVVLVLDHTQSRGTTERPIIEGLVEAARHTPLLSIVIATSPVKHAILHLKCAVIDGWLTVDGSWNMTRHASDEANDVNVIPSRKRAALFTGRIMMLHDYALTKEPQYQVIPPEATVGAATVPPEIAPGTVERTPEAPSGPPQK